MIQSIEKQEELKQYLKEFSQYNSYDVLQMIVELIDDNLLDVAELLQIVTDKSSKIMSYQSFRLNMIIKEFNLEIERVSLFTNIIPLQVSEFLNQTLQRGLKMPLTSEKARSERIISPILLELKELNNDIFTIFSDATLDVDTSRGLNGECDFLISKQKDKDTIEAPIFILLEAKQANIEKWLGQCVAQMYAAQIFNEQENKLIKRIYGCVSTGQIWQFLKLENQTVFIDKNPYYLNELEKILGIFQQIIDFYTA